MHENRETPSPTVSESRSPAGEGESRTTGMHSSGESDGAVVPMKPSNKATGQAPEAAERVEGRASTKENVQQARAVPAQHGAAASQGLKGVRKVAKERKQEQFTTLLHHLTVNLLRDSYYALKREAAPGVDGVRWAEYEDGLEPRLKDLHERVHRGSYRAQASRRIYMQKPDGRQRPIGIAALEDKIVQQAVVTILNAIYEEDFRGFSYGFRPGRSPHNALDALIVGIERKGVNWIVDADIRGFFDNMSHEWTMRFIQHRVADKRIHRLIQKWLKAGISEDGEWSETKVGTPQGAVVSPLLANVYLHYAFDLWLEVWRKKVAKGKVMAIRYADDLVVGFERRDEAERFLKEFGNGWRSSGWNCIRRRRGGSSSDQTPHGIAGRGGKGNRRVSRFWGLRIAVEPPDKAISRSEDRRRGSDWRRNCKTLSRSCAVACTSRYRRSGSGWSVC